MRTLEITPFPFSVGLIIGKKEWLEYCDRTPVQEDRTWLGESTLGEVHSGGSRSLVRLSEECTDEFLVHEAVHVVQQLCDWIGESTPSHEFQAYTTQYVFKWMQSEMEKYSATTEDVPDTNCQDEQKGDEVTVNAEPGQE